MKVRIAPSILSADFAALGVGIAAVERGGADLIHVDIMDGHFVPNLTMGPPVVVSIRKVAKVPLDVHLMIEDPDRYLEAFVRAGAAMITSTSKCSRISIGPSSTSRSSEPGPASRSIRQRPVGMLEEIAGDLDHVLVMSVNPGFGGQTFIPRTESKIEAVRALLDRQGSRAAIEVDGGIDTSNAAPGGLGGRRNPRCGQRHLWRAGSGAGNAGAPRRGHRRVRSHEHAASGKRSPFLGVDRQGPVCGDRPDARRLLRQLFRLVRGRARRFAADVRVELPGDGTGGVSLPVIDAHCQYHRSVRYDDELEVRTEGRLLSKVRMEFVYQVVRRDDQSLAASGRTIHAAMDPTGKPCRLPDRIQEVFA